jgi:2Fe-2S ferredoxin
MMASFRVTQRDGANRVIAAEVGFSVMELIRNVGVDELLALCGGCLSCGTCHVYVDAAFFDRLPPMKDEEDELLSGLMHRSETSRLACQIPFSENLDGLSVTVAIEE